MNTDNTSHKRPQFRVFSRSSDEESGQVWWTKEETFCSEKEAKTWAAEARAYTGRSHVVRGPGEPKPKDGYMSEDTQERELRARFAEASHEEQDAYMGR